MNQDEPFTPDTVDEQVERFSSMPSQESLPPEGQVIQRLHTLYEADQQSTERVWGRLAQRLAEHDVNAQPASREPEDAQAIGRIRERWLWLHPSFRPPRIRETLRATEQDTQTEGSMMETTSSYRTKPWIQTVNQMVAVLMVSLLVGILVTTFVLIEAGRSGKHQGSIGATGSVQCVPSGMTLTEGLRLSMLSETVGWAVGVGPTHDNNYGSVLRTTDGGKHWQDVTPPGLPGRAVSYLYTLDDNTAWLPAWQNRMNPTWLYRTVDAGATWQRFNWPAQVNDVNITFVDQDHGWVGAAPSLLHTNDGGKTWQKLSAMGLPAGASVLQFCNLQTGWATDYSTGELYMTQDGGQSWKQQSLEGLSLTQNSGQSQKQPSLVNAQGKVVKMPSGIIEKLMFINGTTGYFEAGDNSSPRQWSVYITQNSGKTWQRSGGVLSEPDVRTLLDTTHISADTVDPSTGNWIMLLLTLKNGQWVATRLNQPSPGGVADFSFTSVQNGVALIGGANRSFTVYRTSDGGKTWQQIGSFPKGS